MTWMQTLNGTPFSLIAPKVEDIDFSEVAHALSHLCRFAGHTRQFYSVAEHSCRVADILPRAIQLYGLLHDAHEAYTGDWTTPVKAAICANLHHALSDIQDRIQEAVHKSAGIDEVPHESIRGAIKYADLVLLMTERRDLMGPKKQPWGAFEKIAPLEESITAWTPERARLEFMTRLNRWSTLALPIDTASHEEMIDKFRRKVPLHRHTDIRA